LRFEASSLCQQIAERRCLHSIPVTKIHISQGWRIHGKRENALELGVLAHTLPFVPASDANSAQADLLAGLPEASAVFSLGFGERREPYIARTSHLRRRLQRMLAPEGALSRRLQLLPFVREIAWSPYGSEFEASLILYREIVTAFTVKDTATVRKRLRLRPPAYLRMAMENDFPRLFATNRYVRSAAERSFGPFPTRAAAERACDAVLDLFQLRRCVEDLHPFPEHPACPYFEMKKCLAPCNQTATPDRHHAEADAVFETLRTHGASLLFSLERERAAASEALEFEAASAIHQRYEKAETALRELPESVRLLSELSAVIVQPSAQPGEVALFRLTRQGLGGPVAYATVGMRLHNEQSGSSSLYSHPMALAAVPLEPSPATGPAIDTLEERLHTALHALESMPPSQPSTAQIEDHLALFTRWCFRPLAKRTGEAIFAGADGAIPQKPLLRAISRIARGAMAAAPAPTA
jgi:excinuclease ABC subunit C